MDGTCSFEDSGAETDTASDAKWAVDLTEVRFPDPNSNRLLDYGSQRVIQEVTSDRKVA
jgi:hypothetical protein